MKTTFDVRIWAIDVYKGTETTTYKVVWVVDGRRRKEPFKTAALAESFRSALVTAARKGEAFDIESGRPVSMLRNDNTMSWYDFACKFVDMKWPHVAATTRRTHAEAMTAITPALFTSTRGKPDDKLIRKALNRWAFNTQQRGAEGKPQEVTDALRWISRNTRPVSTLADPKVLRPLLNSLAVRLDGQPAAPSVVSRRRKILNTSVEYAVELKLLDANPIPALKWKPPKAVQVVDRRAVPNPVQARTLINAVRFNVPGGARLAAFFGCLYFAGMRPEEAVALKLANLHLPKEGWGEFEFGEAEPHAGKEWTDSGENRDRRQLKQREVGERRTAPCPPELTALIHWHLREFGTGAGGRLFVGERNRTELPKRTIITTWRLAREHVFIPDVVETPLAKRPYDLRHAAVSTWLNGGVPPTDVALWAGQSVEVLFRIYAACLDKGTEILRRRVSAALGY
ncbi:integrase [Dactylosporangium sp. NPDC049742]|uniref:tyrosine-type recombinase/integrase n=1 Tax=Dactylosporangium sp. NPDC049742 TaxID=3154737 RepID=UPI00341C170B